jgi:hypothetical protein
MPASTTSGQKSKVAKRLNHWAAFLLKSEKSPSQTAAIEIGGSRRFRRKGFF